MTFLEAWKRGRYDGKFWAKHFLGVDLHPGQERLFNAYLARHRGIRWWVAAYLTICLSAGNRAGKTLVMALVILHSCMYKMGQRPPENDAEASRWRRTAYHWYHFAIQQEVAILVYSEITNLLQGIHVAQKGTSGCPLIEMVEGPVATWDQKDMGEYPWIVLSPELGGAQIKFRTTKGNKGMGQLGQDMHGISFDECGLEPNLQWIFDNVIHLRRLGTGGQVCFFSTPEEGLTQFSDIWFLGDPEQPDRRSRRMSLRMSTRDNVGFGLDQKTFDVLVGDMDEDHIKQNIDGYFIQGRTAYFNANSVDRSFVEDLPEHQSAKPGHMYSHGVDPAITTDAMWSIVLDVFEGKSHYDKHLKDMVRNTEATGVAIQRAGGRKTTEGIAELAETVHYAYQHEFVVGGKRIRSECTTAVDSTGFGGHMFRQQLDQTIEGGVRSIEFGGTTQKKRKLLGDLRTMLDTGRLKMPRSGIWLQLRRQLLGYKLDDRHIEQDAVMALACAVTVVRTMRPGGEAMSPFDALTSDVPLVAPKFNPRKRRSPRA